MVNTEKHSPADIDPKCSTLPMDHPVLNWKPDKLELREIRKKCIWMRIECNAWRYHDGPCCGLESMSRINRCKRIKS
jgi:hypothetical protein